MFISFSTDGFIYDPTNRKFIGWASKLPNILTSRISNDHEGFALFNPKTKKEKLFTFVEHIWDNDNLISSIYCVGNDKSQIELSTEIIWDMENYIVENLKEKKSLDGLMVVSKKITAIKIVRSTVRISLYQAKTYVEYLMNKHRIMQQTYP
jgi:hypothetical protein